jgi:amidase
MSAGDAHRQGALCARGEPAQALNRRAFLRSALAVGIGLTGLPRLTAQAAGQDAGSRAPPRPDGGAKSFELEEAAISDLADGMRSGQWTSRALAEMYFARIESVDRSGPSLRSVIELNPDAVSIAGELDRERKEKGPRGPLHGVPILIKDNIDTADRMATTAGSLALVGVKPRRDAFLVERLRAAGAVILGKTNLSEWANIRSNRSTSGWSGRGGLTRNPYALDRNTSGSSSGSGAAVAANLCAAAIGTETDGSIVSPSSVNGIVGLKPTVGRVSRSGVIPISHSQDTAGPMARTVRDAAILLDAMAGEDPRDSATLAAREAKADSLLAGGAALFDPKGLAGARIGVVRKSFGFLDTVDRVMEGALDVLKREGAVLVDPANIETAAKLGEHELTVLLYELKADLNAYLATLGDSAPVRSLREVIEFNERHRAEEMPYFGQEYFIQAEAKGSLESREYIDALATCRRLLRADGIDAVMDGNSLDALVAPTEGPAWVTDFVNGDHFLGGSSTLAAVAGYPSITVPAGFVFGLPVGISFFGRAWSEPKLIRLAYAFEQATRARKTPRFLATADFGK